MVVPIQRDGFLRTGRRMDHEAIAFQRRLEHTQKSFLVVDGENTFFLTAIYGYHPLGMSMELASRTVSNPRAIAWSVHTLLPAPRFPLPSCAFLTRGRVLPLVKGAAPA